MEKLTAASSFLKYVEALRNTECSQREKLNYFHQISDSILSPSMRSNANFNKHASSAISVLLFFCEDLDSVTRMGAEENLNKIIRSLENGRVSRILLDMCNEIKKNGNQKSLRICLNLFSYYCPRLKEKNVKWYALKLLPSLQVIAQRKETLLLETLCDFIKSFSQHLQICLNDNETFKLIETFLKQITADCAVKRRCSSQNCVTLIENSRNKALMAKHALSRALDFIIDDQQVNTILGVLGFLRLLLPILSIKTFTDCKDLIEIYDLCLYLLGNGNHSIINASLEVINTILCRDNRILDKMLASNTYCHNEILKKKKSLKNRVFHLETTKPDEYAKRTTAHKKEDTIKDSPISKQTTALFAKTRSDSLEETELASNYSPNKSLQDPKESVSDGEMKFDEIKKEDHLSVSKLEEKSQSLSDFDNESFNSIDFESEITIGERTQSTPKKGETTSLQSQKSTDSVGSFFNNLLSHPSTESMTKLFRATSKTVASMSESAFSSHTSETTSCEMPSPKVTVTKIKDNLTEEDTISLESIISLQSQNSQQTTTTQDPKENENVLLEVEDNETKGDAEENEKETDANNIKAVETNQLEIELTMDSSISHESSKENESKEHDIGTIHDQNILHYTVRLLCSEFLLTGVPEGLILDSVVRVSIKSMSLNVISNCVRLRPDALRLPFEIDKWELQEKNSAAISFSDETNENSNSNDIENEFDMGDVSNGNSNDSLHDASTASIEKKDHGELEIKDDHFGESTTIFDFSSHLSKSSDEMFLRTIGLDYEQRKREQNLRQPKLNQQLENLLSKSEIIVRRPRNEQTKASPAMKKTDNEGTKQCPQYIYDIILYHKHSDPVLRGNLLAVVSHYIHGSLTMTNLSQIHTESGRPNLNELLAILMKGLRDEIHTVLIQALNCFDRIFSLLLINFYKMHSADELYAHDNVLFGSEDLKRQTSDEKTNDRPENTTVITPKDLLNQLQLCFDNKYWLVQNKYCDVIANLDFQLIEDFYSLNMAHKYETIFLSHLLQLIGDIDHRVREHVSDCICQYIVSRSKSERIVPGAYTDVVLLEEYLRRNVFQDIPSNIILGDEGCKQILNANGKRILSKILYHITNLVLELDSQNKQLGVIHAIQKLITVFPPIDYYDVWNEFKLVEICSKYSYQNYATAIDLGAQCLLVQIITDMMSANILYGKLNPKLFDLFFVHLIKILNIYYHLFADIKPVYVPTVQNKGDMFANAKELALLNNLGYFGNDCFYTKLYTNLKTSYESYKISINYDSGMKLMSLLHISLNSITCLLEFKASDNLPDTIKIIKELLQYLNVLINFAAAETVTCLKFLLRYLFGRNCASRFSEYQQFLNLYLLMKTGRSDSVGKDTSQHERLSELLSHALKFPLGKSRQEEEHAKHIKLFEPLVIYSLTLFMKSNATVQGPILDLLSQLIEFNVTYSILDSKNVIFDQVVKNVELIEAGIARNSTVIIRSVVRFFFHITKQNDNKLITIPKIISMINSLLANNTIRKCSILALKELAYAIFFNVRDNEISDQSSYLAKELITQKEVVLGMLEKFLSSSECLRIFAMLLLWPNNFNNSALCNTNILVSTVLKAMLDESIQIQNPKEKLVLESFFRNCEKDIVLESKNYETLLACFIKLNINNFSALTQANLILRKVIFQTEEIFLTNHLKLYLKNNPNIQCESEISYFTKVLYEKIETCLTTIMECPNDRDYRKLVVDYIRSMQNISRFSHLSSSLRLSLLSIEFCEKYSPLLQSNQALEVEVLGLFCELNYDKTVILQYLMDVTGKRDRKHIILKLCKHFADLNRWTLGEIKQLMSNNLLPVLVEDCPKLLIDLCQHEEYSFIVMDNLLNRHVFDSKESVINSLKLITAFNKRSFVLKLKILWKMLSQYNCSRAVTKRIEEYIRNEINSVLNFPKSELEELCPPSDFNGVRDMLLKRNISPPTVTDLAKLSMILNQEGRSEQSDTTQIVGSGPVAEEWLIKQIVELSQDPNYNDCIVKVLIDLKSESKLNSILATEEFNRKPLIRSCIEKSFEYMLKSFHNDCVQYNPHINYVKIHPLLKVSLIHLLKDIQRCVTQEQKSEIAIIASSVSSFLENLKAFEHECLIYVESKLMEKFIKERIFFAENFNEILIKFSGLCAEIIENSHRRDLIENRILWKCIDSIFKQRFVWIELNSTDKYQNYIDNIFGILYDELLMSMRNTNFYEKYLLSLKKEGEDVLIKPEKEQKAVFVAKLIETHCDNATTYTNQLYDISSIETLKSVAISLLRTNKYFPLAATPYELLQNYGNGKKTGASVKFPSIPVEYLSDVDILQKFVKRLSIFGFSTRQQFEEYFMTFLLLTNKVYDENMVDEQEQFQIKSICMLAIQELLITCKTFPVVGNNSSHFLHCPRWARLKCNTLSLKKLYKVHLTVPGTNVFFQPNLECISSSYVKDNIIQTKYFIPNQYDLNYIWQQMEGTCESNRMTPFYKSSLYYSELSGIDLKSSCQLIFDVYCQFMEQNHLLVLPNLIKFCEICDNRLHIKLIFEIVTKLQESIPMDDVISHQYVIFLLCKTQSILVPSYGELLHLCTLISAYLRSSHIFVRNATLHGLLCLLECCAKTNTTMGKLSDELVLLKDLICAYIIRPDSVQESDTHTKLVWTLAFSLIEVTTKFDPHCNLLANTIVSANNVLKRTSNETVYLCILHGLERVLISQNISRESLDKIEKLVLELVKVENEKFSLPALRLFISCVYIGSAKQIENTEHSNGIVQDDPEVIVQQTEKVDILLHRIKSSTKVAASVYGDVLCQMIRDLVPPNEILTKVIKELLTINQPHSIVIAQIVYQVFRSAIDSSFLQMLQDWLICSLSNFTSLGVEKSVWCLTVIFISASINQHLLKLFPYVLNEFKVLNDKETSIFVTSARDFYSNLNVDQKTRFKAVFVESELIVFKNMLMCL